MEEDAGRARHVRLKGRYDVVFQEFLKVTIYGCPLIHAPFMWWAQVREPQVALGSDGTVGLV